MGLHLRGAPGRLVGQGGGNLPLEAQAAAADGFGVERAQAAALHQDFPLHNHGLDGVGASGIDQLGFGMVGGQSLYFRDPDQNLLELATPGTWSIY